MIQQILQQQGDSVVKQLQQNLQSRGVNASGNLSRSIQASATVESYGYRLVVDAAGYALVTEDGRGPTKKSGSGVLFPRILQWTKDKGISAASDKERKSIAWAITKTIHEQGTRLYRSGGASGVISDVVNERTVRKIEDAVFDRVEVESIEAIVKNTNKRG